MNVRYCDQMSEDQKLITGSCHFYKEEYELNESTCS